LEGVFKFMKRKKLTVWKDTSPSCVNCQTQFVLGWLGEHLATIEWWMEQNKKEKK